MSITLTPDELVSITGYRRAADQLRVLHERGFWRAWRHHVAGVVLERAHFEAVSRGEDRRPDAANGGRPRLHLKAA